MKQQFGWTPLETALIWDHEEIVRVLLESKATLNDLHV